MDITVAQLACRFPAGPDDAQDAELLTILIR